MSVIDEQIKELIRKKAKIEFLKHILNSVIDYDQQDFADVQPDVVTLMTDFVNSQIEGIENGSKSQPVEPAQPNNDPMSGAQPKGPFKPNEPAKPHPNGNVGPSVQEQASFAIANRHLSGVQVIATNDQGGEAKGEVVGLDCPNVVIKTTEGVFIKAPRERIREI